MQAKNQAASEEEQPEAETAAESAEAEAEAEDKTEGESAHKSIDIGDSLPSLTLKNEKNEDINVADLTAEKGVVLFLVPKADTR